MVVQLDTMPINGMDTWLERFERKYYLVPAEVGFVHGLLR
jgi:hypothetical protein